MRLTRHPSTAPIKMLASSTSALFAIPLLAGRPQGRYFSLPVSFLRRNEKTERLAMTRERQGLTPVEVTRHIFTELAHPDLFSFHLVYSSYASLEFPHFFSDSPGAKGGAGFSL